MPNSSKIKGRVMIARLALIAAASAAVAGCSADAGRFAEAPPEQGGPNRGAPDYTGSIGSAPTGRVDSSALPPPGAQASYGAPAGAPYGGSQASYASPNPAGQPLYGAPNYASATSQAAPSGPAAAPGTHVVQGGETLGSVARMYGLQPAQLGAANNIAPGMTVRTGQTLVIPPAGSFTPAPTATASTQAKPAPGAKPAGAAATKPQTQAMGTLGTMPANPAVAATKPLAPAPAQPTSKIASAPAPAPVASAAAPKAAEAKVAEPKVETAAKVTPVADVDDARSPGSGPQFRAPVRGRVIASFGPKPGGAQNYGVNFAVPEGTGVRAAEDGVVTYSGNELKNYGNLVLIKHADGYVTAYAHNSELSVKKGDTVRRGQIISKAGQSGDVTTPQLHFEIRKGSTAVDPSRYVAGL